MGWIDRLIDAGIDGVDLRLSTHGSLADDAYEYGFNEPILEKYQKRFGADLLGVGYDLERLSQLRGEHYTAFLRQASERVRSAKRKFQVHVHTEAFRPAPCHGQLMGFPANLHFDWKAWLKQGLVDGITLRTSWFEAPEADRGLLNQTFSDPVVEEALGLTGDLGIPVYLNRYLKRANSIEEYVSDLDNIFHDERFAGFDIYEFAHVSRPTPDAQRAGAGRESPGADQGKGGKAWGSIKKRSQVARLNVARPKLASGLLRPMIAASLTSPADVWGIWDVRRSDVSTCDLFDRRATSLTDVRPLF